MTDTQLLKQYLEGSNVAFAELVRRHADWVYSVARRRLRDAHLAEDVAQAVFVVLARKAGKLRQEAVLSAWLFQVVRLTCWKVLRDEARRKRREREAALRLQSIATSDEDDEQVSWAQLEPLLDESVARLRRRDREALLLRFYQRKTFSEVAAAIGSSEDAARKRVSRAIERLRSLLARRGVTMAPALLATIIWEQAAGAAPASLISAAQTILIHPAVQSANLAKGTILMLNVQKAKVAAVAFVIILAAGLLGIALVDRATGQVEHPHAAAAQRPEAASPASKEFKVIQITPILNVQDLEASLDFYVNKLGFEKQFEHGDPPTFASVARDGLAIFLAQGEQGQPGTWIYIAVSEVDTLHQDISARGAEIAQPPEDRPWGMREMLIEDPDAHQIRIGSMMPHHAPPEKK